MVFWSGRLDCGDPFPSTKTRKHTLQDRKRCRIQRSLVTKLPVRYGESTNPDPGRLGLRIRRRCTFCSRILSFDPQVLSFLKLPLLLCPGTCCKIDHLHNEKSHRITTPSSTTNLSTPLNLNTSESNIVACSKLCSKAASSQGDAEVAIDRLNRTRQAGFRELVSLHVFDRGNPHFSLIKRSHSTTTPL